jgi:hypothetical protein
MASETARRMLAAAGDRQIDPVQVDPVLAALIGRLPPAGSIWSAKKRAAWMQMVWLSFELVYDLDAGDALEIPKFLEAALPAPAAVVAVNEVEPAPPAPKPTAAPYAFMIDRDGFARHGDGRRLLPRDVGGVIYDQRGEGDFATIVWADDTVGVPRGLQLDISPAF